MLLTVSLWGVRVGGDLTERPKPMLPTPHASETPHTVSVCPPTQQVTSPPQVSAGDLRQDTELPNQTERDQVILSDAADAPRQRDPTHRQRLPTS